MIKFYLKRSKDASTYMIFISINNANYTIATLIIYHLVPLLFLLKILTKIYYML